MRLDVGHITILVAKRVAGVRGDTFHISFELSVKKLTQLFEELNCGNFKFDIGDLLKFVAGQPILKHLLAAHELFEQVLHQMHDANCCDFIRGQLNQKVSDVALLEPDIAPLYKYFLLLHDYPVESFDPGENVSVGGRQLVGPSNFNEVV